MKSKILRFLAVCLIVFSGLTGQTALAIPGNDGGLIAATSPRDMQQQNIGSVESQRQTASKLEIPSGGELGRQQVREVIEQADTRSAQKKRDEALKITPAVPRGVLSIDDSDDPR